MFPSQVTAKPRRGEAAVNRQHPLARGLVGAWLFNEGGGTTVRDVSGAGNDGTMANMGAANWAVTKYGRGLLYIDTSDSVDCSKEIIGTGDVSIVSLIRAESRGGGNNGRIIDVGTGNATSLGMSSTNNKLYGSRNGVSFPVSANNSIPYNTWRHVVFAAGASSQTANYYINGELSGTANQATGAPDLDGASGLYIGNRSDNTRGFDGDIVYLLIYDRVLSPSEAIMLYADPWRAFRPVRRWWPSVAAAGGIPTTHNLKTGAASGTQWSIA